MAKKRAPDETRELEGQPQPPTAARPTFRATIQGRTHTLSYQQAFALAHRLLKKGQFNAATGLLQPLTQVAGRGPRAHILLAICLANSSDYPGAREILDEAFQGDESVVASQLHDIIVMTRFGFRKQALQDLVDLVNKHKELPSLCLWLGDLLEAKQEMKKAAQCWRLAAKRDRPGGAVALAAQQQLQRLEAPPPSNRRRRE